MDGVGATFLWEAVPKLPDIDIQRVDWATRKLRLDQNEFSRNRFRKPWIYDKIK